MTQEEIIQAISDDKTMPFIQPEQLAEIVDFVIKNYNPFLDTLPEQPVEGLEEAAHNFALLYDNGTCDEIAQDCFIAGAEYQRKQDQSLIELAEDHAMLAGMNKMKQQMMEKIESRISEILGDAQPSPVLRIELQGIIDKIKNCI